MAKPTLLVVGGGLFGSQAAAYARFKGWEALVFDPGLPGAASAAAAGIFKEEWAGTKYQTAFQQALPILDQLYGLRHLELEHDSGFRESFLWVPPARILEPNPIRQRVTAVGDGWLGAGEQRYDGLVYIAAGVWCRDFHAKLKVVGKAGTAFVFEGERSGRIRPIARGRQALAFVRDTGNTYFSDGTAEERYTEEHERQSLARAADFGLTGTPLRRLHGIRPYAPGGVFFQSISAKTWLATGGRKMGTILGAYCARRLVDEELSRGER
jgi:glycine/D-amino acid oxidase-like deaminating enzyme